MADVLADADDCERRAVAAYLRRRVGSIVCVAGRPLPPSELLTAIIAGFGAHFGVSLENVPLTEEERDLADKFESEKYGHLDWTNRR